MDSHEIAAERQLDMSSDTDDITLADLVTKGKNHSSRSPSPELDDSDNDETYSPSASPDTSDSESKRPIVINIRKKNWWRRRNRPLKRIEAQRYKRKPNKQDVHQKKIKYGVERKQRKRKIANKK